jgi:hypothetical protein
MPRAPVRIDVLAPHDLVLQSFPTCVLFRGTDKVIGEPDRPRRNCDAPPQRIEIMHWNV